MPIRPFALYGTVLAFANVAVVASLQPAKWERMGDRHLSGIAGFVFLSLVAGAARAAPEESCTTGDVEALLQAVPVPGQVMRPRGQDHPGLLEAFFECQYRLFRDGQTFVFNADEPFFGGIVWLGDYVNLGMTRQEAIADIELSVDRVWLAEVLPDGSVDEPVEQTLECTTFKGLNTPTFGLVVYRQCGFITQLPAGEYLSYWLSTYPGLPDETATVTLIIE